MYVPEPMVESRTYVHVSKEAPINVVRYREDEEDSFSVRFGDENFVLEFDEGLMARLIQTLEENACLRHA
ncbi:MAG: hypothetical protein ACRDP6_04865 [Actinoallomurus sp.]